MGQRPWCSSLSWSGVTGYLREKLGGFFGMTRRTISNWTVMGSILLVTTPTTAAFIYSFNSHASTLPLPLTSMAPRGSNTNLSFSFS